MSGSFESVRWNACVHRLDLGLYSHPKEFFLEGVKEVGVRVGMESEPMLTPRGKSRLPEKFSREEDRTHDAASSRTLYQQAVPAPTAVYNPQHNFG